MLKSYGIKNDFKYYDVTVNLTSDPLARKCHQFIPTPDLNPPMFPKLERPGTQTKPKIAVAAVSNPTGDGQDRTVKDLPLELQVQGGTGLVVDRSTVEAGQGAS